MVCLKLVQRHASVILCGDEGTCEDTRWLKEPFVAELCFVVNLLEEQSTRGTKQSTWTLVVICVLRFTPIWGYMHIPTERGKDDTETMFFFALACS